MISYFVSGKTFVKTVFPAEVMANKKMKGVFK